MPQPFYAKNVTTFLYFEKTRFDIRIYILILLQNIDTLLIKIQVKYKASDYENKIHADTSFWHKRDI